MSDFPQEQKPSFDDALPERLLHAPSESPDAQVIPLHHGLPRITSPYIVKLSHEKGDVVGDAFVIEDADIFPDEAPLVEYHEGKMHFAEDYAISQILEEHTPLETFSRIGTYPAERMHDRAIPVVPQFFVEPKDIFSELFSEEPEELKEPEGNHIQPQDLIERIAKEQPILVQELAPEQVQADTPGEMYVISYADGEERQEYMERIVASAPFARKGWRVHAKTSLAFATLAAVMLLPLQASFVFANAVRTKEHVEARSSAGLSQFLRGTDALQEQDFDTASTLFGNASGAFASASDSLNDIHGVVAGVISLIPSTEKTASTARALLQIGEHVSRASTLLTRGMDEVSAAQALSVTDRLALMVAYTEEALPEIEEATDAVNRIDLNVVPEDMREQVARVTALLPILAQGFQEVVTHADALGMLLGSEEKQTYMVVFQNNTELRPTGGFIGSFAEVSFTDGAITDMRIPGGGSYDVQGQLRAFVAAPGPLQVVRARWEFQDANWFPDFPTSARKMLWFYESAGGPSVDGVLAINADVLERLLAVLGPITLEDGRVLHAENVLFEIQKETEITYDKEKNAPKAIIGELTQDIFEKMDQADAQSLLRIASIFVDALNDRSMQVYFSDNTLQSTVKDLGWTGELRTTADDYLMVVHTNIGGGKTDSVIQRDVRVDTFITEDGIIENTVTLTQTHQGMASALFTGINNVDYVRLYVPQGSEFITGTGFELPPSDFFQQAEYPLTIDEDLELMMQNVTKDPSTETDIWNEQGKTVLGNWIQTAPGETQTVSFTYRLPWNAIRSTPSPIWSFAKQVLGAHEAMSYALVVQKQSGVTQNVFARVHVPDSFSRVWSSQEQGSNEFFVEDQQQDLFTGWIFKR